MFKITRLATTITKIQKKVVKNVANGKINAESAKDSFETFKAIAEKNAPYSKNIFKRMSNWVKSFIANFKEIKKGLKDMVQEGKDTLGEAFSKKDKKEAMKTFWDLTKNAMNEVKTQLNGILKAPKA